MVFITSSVRWMECGLRYIYAISSLFIFVAFVPYFLILCFNVHRIDMEILLEPLKKYFHMYVYWAILVFSIVLGTLPPSFSVCIRGLNFYRKRVFIYSFFHCKKGVLGQAHVPVSPREYHVPLFLLLLKKNTFCICDLFINSSGKTCFHIEFFQDILMFCIYYYQIYYCKQIFQSHSSVGKTDPGIIFQNSLA